MKKKIITIALCLILAISVFTACDNNPDPCANGHDWGAWVVVEEATETEDGLRERGCVRNGCDEKDSQVIPKTGGTTEMTADEIVAQMLEILDSVNEAIENRASIQSSSFAPFGIMSVSSDIGLFDNHTFFDISEEDFYRTIDQFYIGLSEIMTKALELVGGQLLESKFAVEVEVGDTGTFEKGNPYSFITELDFKGISEGVMYAEAKTEILIDGNNDNYGSATYYLSAYYNSDDDYGYEILMIAESDGKLMMYSKFDKSTESSEALLIQSKSSFMVYAKDKQIALIDASNFASSYALALEMMQSKKDLLLGDESVLSQFANKPDTVKETYTNIDGETLKLELSISSMYQQSGE